MRLPVARRGHGPAEPSKSGQNPTAWLPLSCDLYCQYAAEWTDTKLRSYVDTGPAERDALFRREDGDPAGAGIHGC